MAPLCGSKMCESNSRSPGSTKETVKTIAQEMQGYSGGPVATMLVCFSILHTGLWVPRAPGVPCALYLSRDDVSAKPRAHSVPRECDCLFRRHCLRQTRRVCAREPKRRSNPDFLVAFWIA